MTDKDIILEKAHQINFYSDNLFIFLEKDNNGIKQLMKTISSTSRMIVMKKNSDALVIMGMILRYAFQYFGLSSLCNANMYNSSPQAELEANSSKA
jgi:hypothetical protein